MATTKRRATRRQGSRALEAEEASYAFEMKVRPPLIGVSDLARARMARHSTGAITIEVGRYRLQIDHQTETGAGAIFLGCADGNGVVARYIPIRTQDADDLAAAIRDVAAAARALDTARGPSRDYLREPGV